MGLRARVGRLFALMAVAGLATACGKAPERHQLTGQVLAIRPEAQEVLIKHQDIPNFMPGMTMPFKVRDRTLLDTLAPGDLVTADLMVGTDDAWIAAITRTGTAPLSEAPGSMPAAAFVDLLEPGEQVPDTVLQGADGAPLSLADFRGAALAVTFIYTRCPLPQFCPMMDRRFAEVQGLAQGTPGLAGRVRLVSVSFDPDTDTPAVLRAHAAQLGADGSVWRFATAPRETVDRFAARFRVNVIRETDQTITHNLRTATIGPDGRVIALHDGNQWTARQIVDELAGALAGS